MLRRLWIAGLTLTLLLSVSIGATMLTASSPSGDANIIEGTQQDFHVLQEEKKVEMLPPAHLSIPSVGIEAKVDAVGEREGKMDTPSIWENVAWYSPGPRPGEPGRAVIAGHLDSRSGPAIFWNLRKLKTGDRIFVEDIAGNTLQFEVREAMRYPDHSSAPVEEIFSRSVPSQIVLITCTGAWNKEEKRYQERLAVYADFVSASSFSGTNSEKMTNRSS